MPRPHPLLCTVVLGALVLAGACSDDGPSQATSTSTTTPTTSTSSTTSTTSPPSTSSTTAAPTTTTTEVVARIVALRGDGLGLVDFGRTPDEVVAAMAPVLGAPTDDTGWQPAAATYSTCPGNRIRAVQWEGLTALFTDVPTAWGTGEHFFQWRQTTAPPPIATAAGISVGASRRDVEEIYPEVVAEEELVGGVVLHFRAEGGPLTGFLDGDALANLEAGEPCGE